MYPGLLPQVFLCTVTHLGVRWMSGGVACHKAVFCLDVCGDVVATVVLERVGVIGGYHGRFITITVYLLDNFL